MLVAEEAVEIRVLSRQGKSIRDIAQMVRVPRNTVRRLAKRASAATSRRADRPRRSA